LEKKKLTATTTTNGADTQCWAGPAKGSLTAPFACFNNIIEKCSEQGKWNADGSWQLALITGGGFRGPKDIPRNIVLYMYIWYYPYSVFLIL